MANEEILRLRTTIQTEEGLAQLRALGREIGFVGSKGAPGLKTIDTTFTSLTKTVKGLTGEVMKAAPALGGLGLGAASIGLAFGAVIRTMNDVSGRIVGLRNLSADLGMSIQQIKGFQQAADAAGSSPEAASAALQSFVKNAEDFKRRIGSVREELYANRAGDLVEAITGAKDPQAAMNTAFARLRRMIQQGRLADAKDLSRILFGSSDVLHYMDQVEEAQKNAKVLTEDQQKALIKYHNSMKDLGDAWGDLTEKMGATLAPGLTDFIKSVTVLLGKFETLEGYLQRFKEWNQGPTGHGTLLGKIVPGYDNQPNYNPRAGGVQRRRDDEAAAAAVGPTGPMPPNAPAPGADQHWWAPRNRNPRAGGARAAGGPVYSGSAYLVGENGPEIMMPSSSGTIIPNGFGKAGSSGGGGDHSEGVRMVKEGVFQALIDFKSYVEAGQSGGGDGFQKASFGGSAGAAAGGGFGGGGYANLGGGGGGGGGSDSGPLDTPNGQAPSDAQVKASIPGGLATSMGQSGPGMPAGGGIIPPSQGFGKVPSFGGGGGTQSYAGGSGKQKAAQAVANEMRKAGLPENAIAGILANNMSESGMDPTLRHADQPKFGGEAHYAHGLFQEGGAEWNTWAKDMQSRGLDPQTAWKDPAEQARFVAGRLKGTIGDKQYAGLYKRMTAPGVTKEQAAQMFVSGYLKPAERYRNERVSQYGRGVPGVEHYTGAPNGQAQGANVGTDGKTPGPGQVSGGYGGNVKELQSKIAGTRKGQLAPETRAMLDYASSQTGLTVEVGSGGQRMPGAPGAVGSHRHDGGHAADFKLRDKDGNLVAINDPRAIAFYKAAGRGGAAGGGAAPGYMGMYTTHLDRGELGGVYAGSPEFRAAIAAGNREYKQAGMPSPTSRVDGAVNTAASGGTTKAEGNVNVTVNSNGTAAKTSAEADGLWQKTTIQNYKQMQPTSSPAPMVASN